MAISRGQNLDEAELIKLLQCDLTDGAISTARSERQYAFVKVLLDSCIHFEGYHSPPGTPLQLAVETGNVELVHLLLERDANIDPPKALHDT
jgi:hypothetical protein